MCLDHLSYPSFKAFLLTPGVDLFFSAFFCLLFAWDPLSGSGIISVGVDGTSFGACPALLFATVTKETGCYRAKKWEWVGTGVGGGACEGLLG